MSRPAAAGGREKLGQQRRRKDKMAAAQAEVRWGRARAGGAGKGRGRGGAGPPCWKRAGQRPEPPCWSRAKPAAGAGDAPGAIPVRCRLRNRSGFRSRAASGARAARGGAGPFAPSGSSTGAGGAVLFARGKKENPSDVNRAFYLSQLCAGFSTCSTRGRSRGCGAQGKRSSSSDPSFPSPALVPAGRAWSGHPQTLREQHRPKALFVRKRVLCLGFRLISTMAVVEYCNKWPWEVVESVSLELCSLLGWILSNLI
ncbi:uncharacterized protein LOC120513362 [Passer montanus]|uniref:uncharacterized protein LOC120513362 n=1 Tax=Passer montanus TaxID=9160 RepID=UPI001960B1B3|nr:uncharacterized protein LOC120513362 [Passer montanus]